MYWIILVFILEFRLNLSEKIVHTAFSFFPFEMRYEFFNLKLLNGCCCNTGQTVRLRENFQSAKVLLPLHNLVYKILYMLIETKFTKNCNL